jgi:hypothetical protein
MQATAGCFGIGSGRRRGSFQIRDGSVQARWIVEEQPDPKVAASAQQPANLSGCMVMVGVRRIRVAADGALSTLLR